MAKTNLTKLCEYALWKENYKHGTFVFKIFIEWVQKQEEQ